MRRDVHGHQLLGSGFSFDFHAVGSPNRLKDHRRTTVFKDLNIWHYAMPADDSRREFDMGQVLDFVIE